MSVSGNVAGNSQEWPAALVSHLRVVVRHKQFDFDAVAVHLRQHCRETKELNAFAELITTASCREIFAVDFNTKSSDRNLPPAPTLSQNTQRSKTEKKVKEVNDEKRNTRVARIKEAATAKTSETMSVSEILEEISRIESNTVERRNAAFDKVLNVLGGTLTGDEFSKDPEFLYLEGLYNEMREKEEIKRLERERRSKELEEQRELQAQREALRRRFEVNHPNEHGFDGPIQPVNQEPTISISERIGDDDDDYVSNIDLTKFQIGDVMDLPEFELILEQVEKDLSEQRGSESIDGFDEPSELAEVLAFLDEEAKKPKRKAPFTMQTDNAHHSMHATDGEAAVTTIFAPMKEKQQSATMSGADKVEFENSRSAARSQHLLPSSHATLQTTKASDDAVSCIANRGARAQPKVSRDGGVQTDGGGSDRRTGRMQQPHDEHRTEEESGELGDCNSDEDDEDDEDDPALTRSRMKQTAKSFVPQDDVSVKQENYFSSEEPVVDSDDEGPSINEGSTRFNRPVQDATAVAIDANIDGEISEERKQISPTAAVTFSAAAVDPGSPDRQSVSKSMSGEADLSEAEGVTTVVSGGSLLAGSGSGRERRSRWANPMAAAASRTTRGKT